MCHLNVTSKIYNMRNIYLNDTLASGNKQQNSYIYIRTINGNGEISIYTRTINGNKEKIRIVTHLPPNGMMTTLCLQQRAVNFTTSSWHSEEQNPTSN